MSGSSSSKKKKESEGIALLSMYYGEEEDEDMDDTLESMPGEEETQIEENMEEDEVILNSVHPPLDSVSIDNNTPPVSIHNSLPPSQQQQQQVFGSRKGIVDYGHDDTAFSPDADAEDGEVDCLLMFGADLQTVNGTPPGTVQVLTRSTQSTPPQSSEHVNQSQSEAMIYNITETPKEAIDITEDEENKMDLLDKFLPPPPNTKCSAELQEKIIKFLLLKKKTGRSFNSEVRNRKEYRNPDFLLHAVTYQDIDQIGSCFSKDVFDPHGYVKSDYYDEIEADLKRELERKEQEKKKSQKIDFLSGGTQTAIAVTTPKVMPIPAVPPVSAGVDIGTREGRLNKKSKWDKVDGDTRHPLTTGGQDSVSAANAGSGYTAFAQQRRKEAEERRSSERKVDRRS